MFRTFRNKSNLKKSLKGGHALMVKDLDKLIEEDIDEIELTKRKLERANALMSAHKKIEKVENAKVRKQKTQLKFNKADIVERILGVNVSEALLTGILHYSLRYSEKDIATLTRIGEKEIARHNQEMEKLRIKKEKEKAKKVTKK